MPRRPIRCRYYTDSGEPIRGGCRRKSAGCSFVHPDDPSWADAEVPLFKPTNKGGDSSTSKHWGEGSRHGATSSSGWDTGGNVATSATDAGGGWGSSSGWDTGGGWGGSISTAPEPAQRKNSSAIGSWNASTAEQNQANVTRTASGNTESGGDSWGASGDKAAGSAWEGSRNDGWGGGWGDGNNGGTWKAARTEAWGAGWENRKDNDKDTGSGWGGASTGASGGSWGNEDVGSGWGTGEWGTAGNNKAAGSGWGSTAGDGWGDKDASKDAGSGWGSTWSGGDKRDADKTTGSTWGSAAGDGWGAGRRGDKDANNSWGISDPMIVDNSAKKGTEPERDKGKGKAVLPPPRIRIPDKENKKLNIAGTNNERLGSSKQRGDSRSSDFVTASTPVTALTPVTTTPIDSTRVKRKRDAFDDKTDVFKEYTKAWERGVRARFLLAEAEVKRDRWFRTQKSACYARVGEAGRKILDGQRAECDEQVNIQREKVKAAITSLVDFHDTIASNIDLSQRYSLVEEMKKFLTDSKTYVEEVRALIVMHVLKEKDDVQPGDQEHPSGVIAALIDSVQGQVRDFEERFEQTRTELTLRRQRDICSEIDELLRAKITESRAARQREIDRIAAQSRPEIVIPPDAFKNQEAMVQQVRKLDAKLPQAVEDIRNLLLQVDATTKRIMDLEQEVFANKETYEKQKRDLAAERESAEQKIDGELEHLRNKFTELIASQPPAQPAAYNPAEKLQETLLPAFEAVLDKFYEQEVLPTIESTQRAAVDESNRYQTEAIKVLWGKIQPAMNMVAGVSQWLDSQELGLTAPVGGV